MILEKKVKAVFFDIDGTLLSFKTHQVSDSTREAIRLLKQKGIKVILSTGRSINSIDHVKDLDFDGFITFNGGYCVTKEGKILRKTMMNQEDIERVMDYSKSQPLSYSFMFEDQITLFGVTPAISGMYESLNLPVPNLMDHDLVDTKGVLQANIFITPEQEDLFMRDVMPNSLASRWTNIFADVNPKGQSKKVGVDVFCTYFEVEIAETMAFGDGGNDIEMLKHVHTGVAMGNANPEVKAISDYVTDDVDHDGIWNALKHFDVI